MKQPSHHLGALLESQLGHFIDKRVRLLALNVVSIGVDPAWSAGNLEVSYTVRKSHDGFQRGAADENSAVAPPKLGPGVPGRLGLTVATSNDGAGVRPVGPGQQLHTFAPGCIVRLVAGARAQIPAQREITQ